jgi:hypothetical protein
MTDTILRTNHVVPALAAGRPTDIFQYVGVPPGALDPQEAVSMTRIPDEGLAPFIQEMMKSIEVLRSPGLGALKRQQDLLDSIVIPTIAIRADVLSAFEAIRIPSAEIAEIGRPLREAMAESAAWREQLLSAVTAINDLVAVQLLPFASQAEQVRSAGGVLLERLGHAEDEEAVDDIEDAVVKFLGAWIRWLRSLPPSRTAWVVATNVFPVLVALWGIVEGRRTIAHVVDHVAEIREDIAAVKEDIASLRVEAGETSFFRLSASAPLRPAPDTAADRLLTLPIGAVIEELRREGQWLSVVYHEPGSAYVVRGWVYNRGLCPFRTADDDVSDQGRLDDVADHQGQQISAAIGDPVA